ncbi:MAG: bifunctional heptose 7-phosphate kinase/heptose 1-phosphate adenyltransferase [Terriglobia bacterium]
MASRSSSRLPILVRRFRGRRLGVVGDLMLDHFIRGSVTRTSPEAPVPVVRVNQPETFHLGGAGNVAANLAALGARPAVFAVVGQDPAGNILRRALGRWGAGRNGVVRLPGRPTTVKTRIIADHQHVVRTDWEDSSPLPASVERRLLDAFQRQAGRLEGVVLSDYDKGVITETFLAELLRVCAARDLPVFLDLKKARRLEGELALLLVNQQRAEEVAGVAIRDDKTLQLVGRHLMARFPCSTLVITRGAQGMVVFEKGDTRSFASVRTRPWEVFDVTGAGDTVMAALALARVSGATPREAAVLANAAAGAVVGKLGTAVCTPPELLANLKV